MLAQRVTDLAEAVADGRTPDWQSAELSSSDSVERGVIAKLRAVQAIHGLYRTRGNSLGGAAGRTQLSPGDVWGSLEIREHVGSGRFGDVYRAWDPALDREVALKLVRRTAGQDGTETKIVEEGRLMARVRHPNVVIIHGAQRVDGVAGLWMELIEGHTLARELAARGPFDAQELTRVGVEVSRALAAVHRAGWVHRDVKAQNVLRDASGRIVLGDFGTGRELDEALREDPDFVMAHILRAHALRYAPEKRVAALEHMDIALAAAERGTAVDRAVARAEWHAIREELGPAGERTAHWENSAASFETVLQVQPDDEWALACLTNVYPRLGRHREALWAAERLVTLRPHSLTALWRAARAAFDDGQVDLARQYADRAAALDVVIDERNAAQAVWVQTFGSHHAWLRNDAAGAARMADAVAQSIRTAPRQVQSIFAERLIWTYLGLGQLRRAEHLVTTLEPSIPQPYALRVLRETGDRHRFRSAVTADIGDPVRAAALAHLLVDAGMLRLATDALDRAANGRFQGQPQYVRLGRGKLALARHRPEEAIRHLQARLDIPEPRGTIPWTETVIALARALSQTGDTARAIDVLEDASRNRDEYWPAATHMWLTVRDQLMQLYRRASRHDEADRVGAQLMAVLAVADEDHPIRRRLMSPSETRPKPSLAFKARD